MMYIPIPHWLFFYGLGVLTGIVLCVTAGILWSRKDKRAKEDMAALEEREAAIDNPHRGMNVH